MADQGRAEGDLLDRHVRSACEAIYREREGYWPSDGEQARIRIAIAAVLGHEGDVQKALGWEPGHPEAFCQECGRPNIAWFAPSADWNRATEPALAIGRAAILCPVCFVALWEAATGLASSWELRPTTSTITRQVADG